MSPSTHPFAPEEVMAYLDGELSPERAAATAAHLEQCGECRALASEMRSVSRQMLAWQVEPSPDRLARGILAAAQVTKENSDRLVANPAITLKPSRRGLRFLTYGLPAFAALLLLFAIYVPNLFRSRLSVQPPNQRVAGVAAYDSMSAEGRERQTTDQKSVNELPLNGRKMSTLTALTPGV